ncbi:MAG: UDP-N-acetylmuramoyl-L-alanine--D-glutamate ligase [Clostridiales bacterium]|nr:UDP-N-acetylmuramoyl-L-alanine--D-glutamate ligase [Clostridiales bacterium]
MNQALEQFDRRVAGARVTVIGIGVSNTPLIRLLVERGAQVTACDRKEEQALGPVAGELRALGVVLRLGEDYLEDLHADLIFKTPGMRYDLPQLLRAAEQGARVTSEMEVFFELCPCRLIGVTGSDGKSTTTTLIAELLRQAGHSVHLGGNLGRPLLPDIEQIGEGDIAVLELSSFQLHTMTRSPHIAVVTNLSPNHLDMHRSMEEYVDAKRNLFRHQRPGDVLVLNADNDLTRAFAGEAVGDVRMFSRRLEQADFYADRRGDIYHGGEPVLRREALRLPGDHNVENMMAAMAAVWDLVSPADILAVAGRFAGLPHRLEPVRELDGVRYLNDSIASSPTRTAACIHAFAQKLILILGGYDKHIAFDELGELLCRRAKAVVLMGATADLIERAVRAAPSFVEGAPPILRCEDMEQAVAAARGLAAPGDIVALSPACASFDRYPNFAARGEHFKDVVRAL